MWGPGDLVIMENIRSGGFSNDGRYRARGT